MLKLTGNQNNVELYCPYSSDVSSKLSRIGRKIWNGEKTCWIITYPMVSAVYNLFDAEYIDADEAVKAYLKSLDGVEHYSLRRIRPDVLELAYRYSSDIHEVVSKMPYKHRVDVNRYTINDDEAKLLIRTIGRHRADFLTDRTIYTQLYNAGSEPVHLRYEGAGIVLECSSSYADFLHNNISSIVKDFKTWEYYIPLNGIFELMSFVGRDTLMIDEAVAKAMIEYEEFSRPVKERLKDIKPAVEFTFKTKPLPHQIEAFNFGMTHNRMLIADSPGLGKTLESLTIACKRSERETACLRNVLIVCGVNSVKYNWAEEIKRHTDEKSVMFEGTTKKKLELIEEWFHDRETLFGIINIEALRNEKICEALKDLVSILIVDEVHKAKNGQTQQGKALKSINASIKIGLSGTPMTNTPMDLWNILIWLDVEHRSVWQFRNDYCVLGGYGDKQIVDFKNLDDLSRELNTVMLRRKKEDVVDLPPKTYQTEYVDLSKSQMEDYKCAKEDVLVKLDTVLSSSNPLTHLLRMRQVTAGLFASEKDNAKLVRIKDLLENQIIPNGDKAIIFTQYEKVADKYRTALKDYNPAFIIGKVSVENRQKEVDRFQNDESCRIAVGTVGAMGTGLTMTAASYVIFVDKDWAQTNNDQSEDRAHRIGTTKNVTIISMVAKDTIDEHIEDILANKAFLFDSVVEGKTAEKPDKIALIKELLDIKDDSV